MRRVHGKACAPFSANWSIVNRALSGAASECGCRLLAHEAEVALLLSYQAIIATAYIVKC